MTVFEPGARLVLTQGFVLRPSPAAFLAKSPAPMSTEGFEVLVHEVMAAMTTEPWPTLQDWPSIVTAISVPAGAGMRPVLSFSFNNSGKAEDQDSLTSLRSMRSWGRL